MSLRITSLPAARSRRFSMKRRVVITGWLLSDGAADAARQGGVAGHAGGFGLDRASLDVVGSGRIGPLGSCCASGASLHVGFRLVGGVGCRIRPERPGCREQETLAETDIVIQQVDHRALAFDA